MGEVTLTLTPMEYAFLTCLLSDVRSCTPTIGNAVVNAYGTFGCEILSGVHERMQPTNVVPSNVTPFPGRKT